MSDEFQESPESTISRWPLPAARVNLLTTVGAEAQRAEDWNRFEISRTASMLLEL